VGGQRWGGSHISRAGELEHRRFRPVGVSVRDSARAVRAGLHGGSRQASREGKIARSNRRRSPVTCAPKRRRYRWCRWWRRGCRPAASTSMKLKSLAPRSKIDNRAPAQRHATGVGMGWLGCEGGAPGGASGARSSTPGPEMAGAASARRCVGELVDHCIVPDGVGNVGGISE
jgi:hypothetical protein